MGFLLRSQSQRIGFALILLSLSIRSYSFEKPQTLKHAVKQDGSLSFLVVGDWGRRGFYNQSAVAYQMGKIGEQLNIDFTVSTGDNFYDNGLHGINDKSFLESFTKVYKARSLQKNWYSVLGNHDYRGDTVAQISPELRKIDSRWVCQRFFILNTEIAEFFFFDTTPFVDDYYVDVDHAYNWEGTLPRQPYLANLLKDLESSLRNSSATWKIVVGHHAIRSAGHHGDTRELNERLLPILKNYDVDMYMNGHDHCLQHITSPDSRMQFFTSGGGSKSWRGDVKDYDKNALKFYYDGQGFMSVKLTKSDGEMIFYDVFGRILHKWKISKALHSDI